MINFKRIIDNFIKSTEMNLKTCKFLNVPK